MYTTYTNSSKGQFSNQYKESGQLNKGLNNFVLSSKFEYGYGDGGRQHASNETKQKQMVEKEEINKIVSSIGQNYKDCAANKANDAKQNFEIKPVHNMPNSTTKNVGDHRGKGIENIIDQNDLKISHLPFKNTGVTAGKTPYSQIHGTSNSSQIAEQVRNYSQAARVPFSPQMRVRSDDNPVARLASVQQS